MADKQRAEADGTDPGMAARHAAVHAPRFVYGPRPVSAVMPAITRPAFRRRAPALATLLTDWSAAVGPALAAVTIPRKLQGGTLSLACSGPVAMELQHLTPQLISRINTYAGSAAVERLRFVQDAPASDAAPPAPKVRPDVGRDVDNRLAGLEPGPLRDALAALGRAVLTRHAESAPAAPE